MFPSEPIIDDGIRCRMQNQFLIRYNPTHIQRCKDAIRRRWANETQHTIICNNVIELTQKRKRAIVKS